MRVLISGVCCFGAVLLTAMSMAMNWSFWTEQGSEAGRGEMVLGGVSIAIDLFKTTLPFIIAWAWAERSRLGTAIGVLFLCACLAFSSFGAIGFATSSRGGATSSREAVTSRHAVAKAEHAELRTRLAVLGTPRPVAVLTELIARAKLDRRWSSTSGCEKTTDGMSRMFCREIADLNIEMARATEAARLSSRAATLTAELDRLTSGGAHRETDPQAGLLARAAGIELATAQTWLVVLTALLVETGAAFGLYLGALPLRGLDLDQARHGRQSASLPQLAPQIDAPRAPTRLVRAANGQLMIE